MKAFVVGLVAGLTLVLVVGVGASRLRQKDSEQRSQQAELAEYQAEISDATPVQRGLLTEKQRIHSALYTDYKEKNSGRTIHELMDLARGSGKVLGIDSLVGRGELLTEKDTPERFFGELAQQSDAIVRGRATNKVSQITEDDGFIFTDYDVLVTEVFKDSSSSHIEKGGTITVTRPGGKVLLDGVIVKARDHYFTQLPVNDHEVVLFLRYIPETGAYRPVKYSGSFELDSGTLKPLTESQLPPGVLRDVDSFLQTARLSRTNRKR